MAPTEAAHVGIPTTDMTPQAPPHPASDSMDVTAAVIASLEASLRKVPVAPPTEGEHSKPSVAGVTRAEPEGRRAWWRILG